MARALQELGWDVRQYNIFNSEWLRLVQALRSHGVTTTLDIGANAGQFATRLRGAGYRGRIVSFEPLSAAHAELVQAAKGDEDWIVSPRVALGDADGIVSINVSNNSASSSLLPMMTSHSDADPQSSYIRTEQVRCSCLDLVAPEYVTESDIVFVKLDVQGYELHVLRGATKLLGKVACIRTELSLVPLYRGQPAYHDMVDWIQEHGFDLWGVEPAFVDRRTGRVLQVDALFCRRVT